VTGWGGSPVHLLLGPRELLALDPAGDEHTCQQVKALGERLTFFAPPGGTAASVWRTDLYTSDSSVCTARVYAGRITLRDGGNVTIEIREGTQGYSSSARQGIETSDFGPWEASFEFAV
jgi:hypothetical protein